MNIRSNSADRDLVAEKEKEIDAIALFLAELKENVRVKTDKHHAYDAEVVGIGWPSFKTEALVAYEMGARCRGGSFIMPSAG